MRFLVLSLLATLSSQQEFNAHRQPAPLRDSLSNNLHSPPSVHDNLNYGTITNADPLQATAPMIIQTYLRNRTFTPTPFLTPTTSPSPACKLTYVVRERDTCEKVCVYQELSLVKLIKLNPHLYVERDGRCPLTVGETLCVMGMGGSSSSSSSSSNTARGSFSPSRKYHPSPTSVVNGLPTTTASLPSLRTSTPQPSESSSSVFSTEVVTSPAGEAPVLPTTASIPTVSSSVTTTASSPTSSSQSPAYASKSSALGPSTVASTVTEKSSASFTTTSSTTLSSATPSLTTASSVTTSSTRIPVATTSSKAQSSSSSSSDSSASTTSQPSPFPSDFTPTGPDVVPVTPKTSKPNAHPSDFTPTGPDIIPVTPTHSESDLATSGSPTDVDIIPVVSSPSPPTGAKVEKQVTSGASSDASQAGDAGADDSVEFRETEGNKKGLWGWLPTTFQTATRGSGEAKN